MVSVTVLLVTASAFWAHAAPAQNHCPDGVRYNVTPTMTTSTTGKDYRVLEESVPGSCIVTLRAGWRRGLSDREACMIIVHGTGHAMAGIVEHSPDTANIMQKHALEARPPGLCMRYRATLRAAR